MIGPLSIVVLAYFFVSAGTIFGGLVLTLQSPTPWQLRAPQVASILAASGLVLAFSPWSKKSVNCATHTGLSFPNSNTSSSCLTFNWPVTCLSLLLFVAGVATLIAALRRRGNN